VPHGGVQQVGVIPAMKQVGCQQPGGMLSMPPVGVPQQGGVLRIPDGHNISIQSGRLELSQSCTPPLGVMQQDIPQRGTLPNIQNVQKCPIHEFSNVLLDEKFAACQSTLVEQSQYTGSSVLKNSILDQLPAFDVVQGLRVSEDNPFL